MSGAISIYSPLSCEEALEKSKMTLVNAGFRFIEDKCQRGQDYLEVDAHWAHWEPKLEQPSGVGNTLPPTVGISPIIWFIEPRQEGLTNEHYQQWVDMLFKIICQLSMNLDVEYLVVSYGEPSPPGIWPTGRPLGEHIEEPPILGVYSKAVLEQLGGVDALFDRQPWYVAKLPSDHTIVFESDCPWNRYDWVPPTEVDFLDSTGVSQR